MGNVLGGDANCMSGRGKCRTL